VKTWGRGRCVVQWGVAAVLTGAIGSRRRCAWRGRWSGPERSGATGARRSGDDRVAGGLAPTPPPTPPPHDPRVPLSRRRRRRYPGNAPPPQTRAGWRVRGPPPRWWRPAGEPRVSRRGGGGSVRRAPPPPPHLGQGGNAAAFGEMQAWRSTDGGGLSKVHSGHPFQPAS